MALLRIGSGEEWSFLNGAWQEGPQGELRPPDGTEAEYVAVRKNEVYEDFTASFRFRLRSIAGARFLFRVRDSRRFYALDIPFGGQQFTSRACWAGMVIADGTPLQRYLNFGLVPGICARIDHWYEVRVEATGPRLRAWIDDIMVAEVEDHTYSRGHLGLAFIQDIWYDAPLFDRLVIEGTPRTPSEPLDLQRPKPHWITPCPETDPTTCQSYANLIKGASGEVLLSLGFGNPNSGRNERMVFLRSQDGGRTWGRPEPATLDIGFGGAPFVRRDGAWVCLHCGNDDPAGAPSVHVSADEGRTWTGPHPLQIEGGWPADWYTLSLWRPVRMRDGSIVTPLICRPTNQPFVEDGQEFYRQYCTAMVMRSEDDGHTWSTPVVCDSCTDVPDRPWRDQLSLYAYGGRSYEVAMDETDPGVLVGLGRPGIDPYVWQL
ncbi:MAG: exo-alpha-sialidase, partial [Armatimonadetes bacterium]|nr:exo-alpha-sialidase [Armatimonadota bacterium]